MVDLRLDLGSIVKIQLSFCQVELSPYLEANVVPIYNQVYLEKNVSKMYSFIKPHLQCSEVSGMDVNGGFFLDVMIDLCNFVLIGFIKRSKNLSFSNHRISKGC